MQRAALWLNVALRMQRAGIANSNTVDLTVKDDQIVASYGRSKTAKQPKKSKNVQIIKKKNARRAISGVSKSVGSFRPDLKVRLMGTEHGEVTHSH